MTFTTWLLGQVKRHDPVGDLARDVEHDRSENGWRGTCVGGLRRRMERLGACDSALATLHDAEQEWHRA